jgi:hypothetical protein
MIYLVALLSVALVFQSYIHHLERKDLYDRIMSQDLGEYRSIREPKTKLTLRRNYLQESMRKSYRAMFGQDKAE